MALMFEKELQIKEGVFNEKPFTRENDEAYDF